MSSSYFLPPFGDGHSRAPRDSVKNNNGQLSATCNRHPSSRPRFRPCSSKVDPPQHSRKNPSRKYRDLRSKFEIPNAHDPQRFPVSWVVASIQRAIKNLSTSSPKQTFSRTRRSFVPAQLSMEVPHRDHLSRTRKNCEQSPRKICYITFQA